jgi:hypothetical protein
MQAPPAALGAHVGTADTLAQAPASVPTPMATSRPATAQIARRGGGRGAWIGVGLVLALGGGVAAWKLGGGDRGGTPAVVAAPSTADAAPVAVAPPPDAAPVAVAAPPDAGVAAPAPEHALVIAVNVGDARIAIDGQVVAEAADGVRVPAAPGEHVIEVTAPGRKPWSKTVKVGRADVQVRVRLERERAGVKPPPPPDGGKDGPGGGELKPPPPDPDTQKPPPPDPEIKPPPDDEGTINPFKRKKTTP